jgi:uncharacterized protein
MALKWTTAQLKKRIHQHPYFKEVIDLSTYISEDSDILHISETEVDGEIDIIDELYYFDMSIKTTLTVLGARSLKPVKLPLDFTVRETFTEDEEDEYRQVDGLTIDLLPVIWSNIYLEKPMRVIHPDYTDDHRFDPKNKEKGVKDGHPAFQKLKDYKR